MAFIAKYRALASKIIDDIQAGRLNVNDKLPSLRASCALHQVSMTTAMACYELLEAEGYVLPKHKKGYFVQRPQAVNSVITFPVFSGKVTEAQHPKSAQDKLFGAHSLATAQLDEKLVDTELLKRSLQVTTKQASFNLNYDEPQGNNSLRLQLAQHFSDQGFVCEPQALMITHGCLDAVLIALETVTIAGDAVAVSSPCYSGLLDILALLNRKVMEIPSTEQGIDISQIEQAMQEGKIQACLLTANHQNPTGHSIDNAQKQQLANLANQYRVPVIEDDVFRELSHNNEIPLPIKYYDREGWVLWCSSFSKSLAPGLRLGWCLPGKFKDQYLRQKKVRSLGCNQPIQLAMADYLAKGHYTRHLKKVNQELAANRKIYINYLVANLPRDAEVHSPTGGLVLWVKLPTWNTATLAEALAKHGVYIYQGSFFSTTALYQDCFRINVGQIPDDNVIGQLKILTQVASGDGA